MNVYPYNDFVDADNGFDFKFNFTNTVSRGYVAVYDSDDNSLVETKVFSNTMYHTKEFSIHTEEPYSSSKNYYWKCCYWIDWRNNNSTTSQATSLFSNKEVLNWSKDGNSITIEAAPTKTIARSNITVLNSYLSGNKTLGVSSDLSAIKEELDKGAEYWCCIS